MLPRDSSGTLGRTRLSPDAGQGLHWDLTVELPESVLSDMETQEDYNQAT